MTDNKMNEARQEFEKACDEHIARHGRNARVYISGPMSGLDREQYMEMFRRAEQSLRDRGYQRIVNPIRVWACRWPWLYKAMCKLLGERGAYTLVLLYDLWLLTRCDLIYKIPGWQQSKGANIESCVAYHFRIWTISQSYVSTLNRKLEKLQKKWSKPTTS